MQSKSLEAITKFPANPCFRLFNGFGLCLGNRVQEGQYPVQMLKLDLVKVANENLFLIG